MGHISKTSHNRYRLQIIHGKKQEKYCKWKADMFKVNTKYIDKNGYAQTPAYIFCTKIFDLENDLPSHKTKCPQWIIDSLNFKSIAIWLMDDGYIDRKYSNIFLHTETFDEDSQQRLVKKLKNLGINSSYTNYFVKSKNKSYFKIKINKINSLKLIEKVKKYIHNSMLY